jgi:hypothetical protein
MSPEALNTTFAWFGFVGSAVGIIGFVMSIYQHFKIVALRNAVDSIDRIAKSAKLECHKLESSGSTGVRVVTALVSSVLNVTTTFMSLKRKHFEGKGAPFIAVD